MVHKEHSYTLTRVTHNKSVGAETIPIVQMAVLWLTKVICPRSHV